MMRTGPPTDGLHAAGGEVYAHLFENVSAGIPRRLYWAVSVRFEPVQFAGAERTCSMACEWIPWDIRDWRQLDGKHLHVAYGDDGVESSFYVGEHHPGEHVRLWLARRAGFEFALRMEMTVCFEGCLGKDRDATLPVSAETTVPFTGVIVVPESLEPRPSGAEEIAGVCAPFVDLRCYHEPELREHAYVLKPKL